MSPGAWIYCQQAAGEGGNEQLFHLSGSLQEQKPNSLVCGILELLKKLSRKADQGSFAAN